MSRRLVVGVDSSTQGCKVLVVDAADGAILARGRARHSAEPEVDPREWLRSLAEAWDAAMAQLDGAGGAAAVSAVSVGAQQHGAVTLDAAGEPVRPALLWHDVRSAPEAARMAAELGPEAWLAATGTVPHASLTLTKLAWLAAHEPAARARVRRLVLPHDYLTHALTGDWTTDRSDASGTGYYDPVGDRYLPELIERFAGAPAPELPRVLGPGESAGAGAYRGARFATGAGLGDNAAAALGLGLAAGDVVVSVGTSGTVFASAERPAVGPGVDGFADGRGGYLPLLATLNAARVLDATAAMLGVDLAELDRLALAGIDALDAIPAAELGVPAAGSVAGVGVPAADALAPLFVPYLEGERTPARPEARGALHGLTRAAMSPERVARAAVLGIVASLAEAFERLRALGVPARRVVLIGGGARSRAVRRATAELFGLPVVVPEPEEYVALGAARQAAWALTGELPDWARAGDVELAPTAAWGPAYRSAFRRAAGLPAPDAA